MSKPFVFALALDTLGAAKVESVDRRRAVGRSLQLDPPQRRKPPLQSDGQCRRDRLLRPDPRGQGRRRVRIYPPGAGPVCRARSRRRRGRLCFRKRDRRPQPRDRLSAAHQCRDQGQGRCGARRLFPAMRHAGDGARYRRDGGDPRQPRHQSRDRRAGDDALRDLAHALGDDVSPACTTMPANGSTGSASPPRAASAAASWRRCRRGSGSAAIRQNSTSTATACAASRSARRCRRITTCICSTAATMRATASSPITTSARARRGAAAAPHEQQILAAHHEDVRVIELVGTLSFSNVDYVSRQLASKPRPQFVIFDLRRVTSMTRAGARLLAEEFRELAAHHVTVILSGIKRSSPEWKMIGEWTGRLSATCATTICSMPRSNGRKTRSSIATAARSISSRRPNCPSSRCWRG